MAKLLLGNGVVRMSGTVEGNTFQNWRGMTIMRRKPVPTNVNTPRQSIIRALMTLLSRAWRDELTPGLRTAWNQRAKNYPWLDVFGNELKMTGENLYIKQNMVLLDHGLVRQDTPVPDIVPPELIDVTIDPSPSTLDLTIPQLPSAVVAAQNPFLDVVIAGGFLDVDDTLMPDELHIITQALPPGRKHQKSDFRHATYVCDIAEAIPPVPWLITVKPPAGLTKNVVVSLRRYNKYGNFTQALIFEGIRTMPA